MTSARYLSMLALVFSVSCTDFGTAESPPPHTEAVCGDGELEAHEGCDDGNLVDTDACRNDCEEAVCGDGIVRTDLERAHPDYEACDDGNAVDGDGCTGCLEPAPETLGGDRPVTVGYPDAYDPRTSYPLMLLLHGFGQNGRLINRQLGGTDNQGQLGYILLMPEGRRTADGQQFWNATPACCGRDRMDVDDLGYLTGLIDEAVERLGVDSSRVFIMGLSNGGFMAERIACDAAAKVAGVVNVSGASFRDAERCQPSRAVTYIRLHSTADEVIPYEGRPSYPGAVESIERWRSYNGCGEAEPAQELDMETAVGGVETTHRSWLDCGEGSEVHLFTMEGVSHVPRLSAEAKLKAMRLVMDETTP